MCTVNLSRRAFNLMRGGIGALGIAFLASVLLLLDELYSSSDHIANVVVDGRRLELQTVLLDKDTRGIAFVNSVGELTAYSVDGTPIDVCHGFGKGDSERKTCKIDGSIASLIGDMSETPTEPLVHNESNKSDQPLNQAVEHKNRSWGSHCGRCDNGWGTLVDCHRDNRTYTCHGGSHVPCDGGCAGRLPH